MEHRSKHASATNTRSSSSPRRTRARRILVAVAVAPLVVGAPTAGAKEAIPTSAEVAARHLAEGKKTKDAVRWEAARRRADQRAARVQAQGTSGTGK